MKGLQLSRQYYSDVGLPMIREHFSPYMNRMTIGLVGDGSDCFGFDDGISQDHDWGPGFCIWLEQDDYDCFGKELAQAYMALPKSYAGYQRKETAEGHGRMGVFSTAEFYARYLGIPRKPLSISEWRRIPETNLATVTNGELFHDPQLSFGKLRQELLDYYPEDIRIKKIVFNAAVMAQSGQYNFPRIMQRNEPVAKALTLAEFVKHAVSMVYLLNKKYRPFYKWMHRGILNLRILPETYNLLAALYNPSADQECLINTVETICQLTIQELQNQGLTTGCSSFLLDHCKEVHGKIHDEQLRSLHIMQE